MRRSLTLLTVATGFLATTPARGEQNPKSVPLGFSKLVLRADGSANLKVSGASIRVQALEQIRAAGYAAVGAESVVFDRDRGGLADVLVGGTVKEFECATVDGRTNCRAGIEWQLFDLKRDAVIFTATTRRAVYGYQRNDDERIANDLVREALAALLKRPGFDKALAGTGTTPADRTFEVANMRACGTKAAALPSGAEALLAGTVVLRTPTGQGSGFVANEDGLILTAAHVVRDGPIKVRFKDESELDGVVVRASRAADVALVRVPSPPQKARCLALGTTEPKTGGEAYVAGAPVGLTFSLTRGIVSSVREIDAKRSIQTDAPVSPGNSGGPLADASGLITGIVSSKLSGGRVEGVAFAVSIPSALAALGLKTAAKTDGQLMRETFAPPPTTVDVLPDEPDPVPTLDPRRDEALRAAAERQRADEQRRQKDIDDAARAERAKASLRERERARDRMTPGYVRGLQYGGIGVTVLGSLVALTAYNKYSKNTSRPEYRSLRTQNVAGWIVAGAGVGITATGFALRPPLPAEGPQVTLGPGSITVGGSFR